VAVEGQIRTRKWQKDGREMASTEVVLDRFNSRLQILSGSRPDAETGEPVPAEANTPLFDKRFQFDELPF